MSKIRGVLETIKNLQELQKNITKVTKQSLIDVGNKIIELSSKEVPLDEGTLLRSADVFTEGDKLLVGYNTEYAVRLHYHPEYRFQNGRKAFYLTDPVKRNTKQLNLFYQERIKARLKL